MWSWIRARRWYWQVSIFLVGGPLLLVVLYVAGRSVQYLTAEGDASLFVPAGAQAVLRVKELERHLDRIEDSYAWRTLQRKVLRNPAIRKPINRAMADAGVPTLDDLEDVRKASLYNRDNLVRAAGRDLVASVRVGDDWKSARFCVVTRLRWSDYLLAPLAHLVLKSDQGALKTPGKLPLWIAFEGALALAANNADLLAEARLGKGKAPDGARPVEARLRFENSKALPELLDRLERSGLVPFARVAGTRAAELGADVDGGTLKLDLSLEGAVAARPGSEPPGAPAVWAPSTSTGLYATSAYIGDVVGWLRTLKSGPLTSELDRLDKYGFSSKLLPLLAPGMTMVLGAQEGGTQLFPAFVLYVPSPDPKAAAAALSEVVKGVGGSLGQSWMDPWRAGGVEGESVRLPLSLGVSDFVQPTWAAVPGGLVFGNNLVFTQAAAAAAADGSEGGLRERRAWKKVKVRLKELGFADSPNLLTGVFLVPAVRESLDGVVAKLARELTYADVPDATLRAELDAEQKSAGRPPLSNEEAVPLINERREAKIRDREEGMRADLAVMEAVRWLALSGAESKAGVAIRVALGFDALDR